MKLSILMPVYNECATLDDILDRILAADLPNDFSLEIVIVDDGSDDSSWEIAQQRAAADKRIRVYRNEKNSGKGASIKRAVEEASGDIAIIQDADLEYSPSDYPRLLKPILIGEADVVYGSRFASGEYRRVLLFWHSIANHALTAFSNMLTDLNLTDMETCYKVFRMDVLKSMPIRSKRFGIEPEITAKIAKRKLRIFEVPIRYSGRTYIEGKKIRFKDALQAVWVIIKFSVIDDLYNERYGEETLRSMELATRFTRWVMDRIRPHISGTVLEVGSGLGNNVRSLLDKKQIIATEPDPEYVLLLKSAFSGRRRIQVVQWDASQPPPPFPEIDTVLCANVLEHIEDEAAALDNMHSILKPGGRLVLVLPAGEQLFGTLDKALDHFRRYASPTLKDRLERAGFQLETSFDMNRVGVLGWWFSGKVLKRTALSRFQLKAFNILTPLFRLIDPILPWTGLSLVVVARKN